MIIKQWELLSPRQIDALIATKILKLDITIALSKTDLEPVFQDGTLVPLYSEHIAAAWGLIQKAVSERYNVALDFLAAESCWRCLVDDKDSTSFQAKETTPERAICKALLMREGIFIED